MAYSKRSKPLFFLILLTVFTLTVPVHAQDSVEMLWSDPMQVNDLDVSGDGLYVAAVNYTGLYYFSFDEPDPLWWYPANVGEDFLSVATSYDGSCVAFGNDLGYIYYFDDCKTRTGLQGSHIWRSKDLGGLIARRTLDISDDGECVAVGGTGTEIFYYKNSRGRTGDDQDPTWSSGDLGVSGVHSLDLSADGEYLAAGGSNSSGFVVFYKNARSLTGTGKQPDWNAWSSIDAVIRDIAVSDDGYAVAAIDDYSRPFTLYYWADASTLSGDPSATWTRNKNFASVDMSSNGDAVVAGIFPEAPCGIHFWNGARTLSGVDLAEDWTRHEGEHIPDVAVSDDGGIVAGVAEIFGASPEYWIYFYRSDGSLIGEFELLQDTPLVAMSADGGITAAGGPGYDSLYVFEITGVVEVDEAVGGELLPLNLLSIMMSLIAFAALIALVSQNFKKTWI
jgi:hypothetical protein